MEMGISSSLRGKLRRLSRNLNLDEITVAYSNFKTSHQYGNSLSPAQADITTSPNTHRDDSLKKNTTTKPTPFTLHNVKQIESISVNLTAEEAKSPLPYSRWERLGRYTLSLFADLMCICLANFLFITGPKIYSVYMQNKSGFFFHEYTTYIQR